MFFSFDGVDGAGKSTQIRLFSEWLIARPTSVAICRDPGSTELGEQLREILLHRADTPIGLRSEMLMYMAARAQLVDQVIRPALDKGDIVVSDRFLLANVVYQGHAGGLSVEDLWNVGSVAVDRVQPDLTFILDMPADKALARMTGKPDRMEAQGLAFMDRVRAGFLAEAERHGDRIRIIDADRDIDTIQEEIRALAIEKLS